MCYATKVKSGKFIVWWSTHTLTCRALQEAGVVYMGRLGAGQCGGPRWRSLSLINQMELVSKRDNTSGARIKRDLTEELNKYWCSTVRIWRFWIEAWSLWIWMWIGKNLLLLLMQNLYWISLNSTGCPNKMLTHFDRLILQLLKIKGTYNSIGCLEQDVSFKMDFIWLKSVTPIKSYDG